MKEILPKNSKKLLRHLVIVLGDQLDRHSSAFNGFDSSADEVWMAEVQEEAEHVWSSKARIVMFLSAMRHFAESFRKEGISIYYRKIDSPQNNQGITTELVTNSLNMPPNTSNYALNSFTESCEDAIMY